MSVDDADAIRGKRVLVVEDGPTLTHGSMKIGAGVVAAQRNGAAEIVDPRPWAFGTIAETFDKYEVGAVLPAMGYSDGQLAEMEKIIDAADVDLVVIGTPIDLRRVIDIGKPPFGSATTSTCCPIRRSSPTCSSPCCAESRARNARAARIGRRAHGAGRHRPGRQRPAPAGCG